MKSSLYLSGMCMLVLLFSYLAGEAVSAPEGNSTMWSLDDSSGDSERVEEELAEIVDRQPLKESLAGVNGTSPHHQEQKVNAAEAVQNALPMSPAAAKFYYEQKANKEVQASHQKTKEEVTKDILDQVFGQGGVSREQVSAFVEANQEPNEYDGKNILAFVSSSMPDVALKNFLRVLGPSKRVAFVLRGVVGDDVSKILPTQKWIRELVCWGPAGKEECYAAPIDINPVLYERLQISEVPAVVYVPEPNAILASCDGVSPEAEDYLVFYGDYSPVYALEKFIKARPDDEILRKLYTEITGKGFFQDTSEALKK